ncbi:hypothetical protein [Luteimonas mephitis]|uniref:hypothetical protein n=1 Tax=Luteimonas mephitis TaxID=83615 RepID=UPI003A8D6E38
MQKSRFSTANHAPIFHFTQVKAEGAMNIHSGLLFLDGHIADPGLALSLSIDPQRADAAGGDHAVRGDAPTGSTRGAARRPLPQSMRRHAMNLFQTLLFLGGRPMTAGHNYDAGEPFPQTYGNRVASARMFKPLGTDRRGRAPRQPPSRPCTQG